MAMSTTNMGYVDEDLIKNITQTKYRHTPKRVQSHIPVLKKSHMLYMPWQCYTRDSLQVLWQRKLEVITEAVEVGNPSCGYFVRAIYTYIYIYIYIYTHFIATCTLHTQSPMYYIDSTYVCNICTAGVYMCSYNIERNYEA